MLAQSPAQARGGVLTQISSSEPGQVEKLLCFAGGGALALDGLRRRDLGGLLELMLGAALVQRALTQSRPISGVLAGTAAPPGGAAESSAAPRFLRVHQSYTVRRPAAELYAHWRRLENLPGFMEHLQEVVALDERRSRWVARAPLGRTVEWEAEIVEDVPGERIAWHSLEGSEVANAGSVTFRPAPGDRGTEVHVSLEYAPPAGAVGATLARLFGEAPEQQIRDDLRHFKQLMESGEIPTTRGQPSGPR